MQSFPPARSRPNWKTYAGYPAIVIAETFVYLLVSRNAIGTSLVLLWIAFWAALITSLVQFAKYDRRRRIIRGGEAG